MSLGTRRECLTGVRERYVSARGRAEKSQIVDEVVGVRSYHRKYAVQVLNDSLNEEVTAD